MWAWGAEALEKGSAPVVWARFAECLFGAALPVLMLASQWELTWGVIGHPNLKLM